MSLVQCRYNPNHRMKASKREIHEQKCPDKYKCKIKYKHCPYDPLELIKEEDYDNHIKICKSRPKITEDEQKNIEKAKALNDIETEKKEIELARKTYYKGCVEEPEDKKTNKNKKNQNKNKEDGYEQIREKEEKKIVSIINNENEIGESSHIIKDFTGDDNFTLEKEVKEKEKKDENKSKKEKNKDTYKNESSYNKENYFFKYDPNEEDKDIGKFSANIIVPETINRILGYTD